MYTHEFKTLYNATLTETATGNAIAIGGRFTAMVALVKVGTVSGTSPTLDVYIQNGIRIADGTYVWTDYVACTQMTTSDTETWVRLVGSGEEMHAASAAALTAGQMRNGPIPGVLRAHLVVGGTNPSIPVEVALELIP